jgi:hypothetical protein
MIGWRLATAGRPGGATPPGALLGATAVAGPVLAVLVQLGPGLNVSDGVVDTATAVFGVVLYGAAFGLVVAVALVLVIVPPLLLLLRVLWGRIGLRAAQTLLTVLAMAATAPCVHLVTTAFQAGEVTGLVTTFIGSGAVHTSRWCLTGPQE